ncbi:kunitz trypsin inhibitor 5-like [Cornus florida]|uniref:kunitz trypsin inhibitor 5-like n=1 Tax=Cornus florida TaxID=4283 RepID=UPI00289C3841|nr:kunitz trypsin inhibitor 5-like [Cornus florida]
MKTTMLLLSFLLFALSTNPLLAAAQDAVLDSSGERVQTGVDYYVLPAVSGSGGGLTLGPNRNGSNCPLDVVQEQSYGSNGLPLTFTSVNPNEEVVNLITDQNIKFSAATTCVQSTVWKLADFDESVRRSFVTTGGVEGNPGRETLSNWFRIEKYDDDYKLVFCPGVCGVDDFCSVLCGDIGIFVDNGIRRLALSEQPLKVVFKRA